MWEKPKQLLLLAALASVLVGCANPGPQVPESQVPAASALLTAADVAAVVQAAATSSDAPMTIAVTDRAGVVLAVYRKAGAPATGIANFGVQADSRELAVALARTGAYFSNDQAPLSSRTIRYISGIHFPPGISFTPSAALYGIENTNRGCPMNVTFAPGQAIAPARSIDGTALGLGVITGKKDFADSDYSAVNPGGIPLFKSGRLVGGVGVVAARMDVAEYAAYSGAVGAGFGPTPAAPGVVVVDGIALPFAEQTSRPPGVNAGTANGSFDVGPLASAAQPPEGDLVTPTAGPVGGLTEAEVRGILATAIDVANRTRAVIRLPDGSRARFVIAVADLDGRIIGLNRMPDTTVFSIDVAVAKARNLVYFGSNPADLPGIPAGTAVTNRTISFGAQPFFPSGIDGSDFGPFWDLYKWDIANPCTNGHQAANPNQNGVVFFAGSVGLYRNGKLIGALGVSGDGVEQDDYVSGLGSAGFEAPPAIRADQVEIRGVRMPYLKYPRNPEP